MSPSPRALAAALVLALALLVVPVPAVAVAVVVLMAATAVDAAAARRLPPVQRDVPAVVARDRPVALRVTVVGSDAVRRRVRQPRVPDLAVEPAVGDGGLDATLRGVRRGRHVLPPVVVRATGPLGLGRWDHTVAGEATVQVFPDLPAARRLAVAVRQGRFREPGHQARGPLGIGTEFESVRDYAPDDDIRQVNWPATARVERPMSNQFREDTERDVLAVVDCGRLMAAPVGGATRLDLALDAVAAVAAVADAVGDRCGALAFDDGIRRRVAPRRANGEAVVRVLYDLEPRGVDSDYDLAFGSLGTKRALVVVFTDLLESAAARPLLDAVGTLARRHAVVVASSLDDDLQMLTRTPPDTVPEVLAAAVAGDVLAARDQVAADLRRHGVVVVDAPAAGLGAACVAAYLRLKARARV